jgi:hypothetical protein
MPCKVYTNSQCNNTLAISTHVRSNSLINFEIFISINGIFLNFQCYHSQYIIFFDLEEI